MATPTPQIVGKFAVYKDQSTGIWIVRDMAKHEEIAHCPTQLEAFAAARAAA